MVAQVDHHIARLRIRNLYLGEKIVSISKPNKLNRYLDKIMVCYLYFIAYVSNIVIFTSVILNYIREKFYSVRKGAVPLILFLFA